MRTIRTKNRKYYTTRKEWDKSPRHRIYRKTKAENAKIRNEMLNNTFVKKIIAPIPTPFRYI